MIIVQYYRREFEPGQLRPEPGWMFSLSGNLDEPDGFVAVVENDYAEICLFEPKPIRPEIASNTYKTTVGPLDMKRYFEKAKANNPDVPKIWKGFVFPWDNLH